MAVVPALLSAGGLSRNSGDSRPVAIPRDSVPRCERRLRHSSSRGWERVMAAVSELLDIRVET